MPPRSFARTKDFPVETERTFPFSRVLFGCQIERMAELLNRSLGRPLNVFHWFNAGTKSLDVSRFADATATLPTNSQHTPRQKETKRPTGSLWIAFYTNVRCTREDSRLHRLIGASLKFSRHHRRVTAELLQHCLISEIHSGTRNGASARWASHK